MKGMIFPMRMTKKVTSLVLAVLMVVSMMAVMAVSASAATTITTAGDFDAAMQAGGEYVLGADINLNDINKTYSTVPAGKEVTLDFADYTLTAYYGIENDGTLTLKASGNGGIDATRIAIDNFGALTVESGTYTSTKSGGYATVWSEEGCNTVINGGTFTNTSAEGYGVYIFKNSNTTINGGAFTAGGWVICGWSQTSNATVTITKGTFTSTGNAVLSGNGTAGANGNTWTIKGGTFNANATIEDTDGYLACAIYAPNDDTWTISGGTFNVKDGVAVCQRAGTVEIKGGTFNVTGDGTKGKVGDSRVVIPSGSAVVYDSESNYPAQSSEDATTISSGTFNTKQDPIAMVKANDSDPDRVTVTGGTFAGDASDYVDLTDVLVVYTDTQGKTTYYKSNPLGSCSSGTYKLLKDITTTSYINPGIFGSDVTVDLNGHKFTSSSTRGYAVLASRNGDYKMTIKKGTINYTNASSDYAAVQYQGKNNNLTIENVTINSAVAGVAMLSENQNLTIKNSTINATDDFALVTNGSKTKNGTITVKDSTLTSNSVAVYLPGDADATFDNATVSGTTAMYIKGGDVDIIGGSYTGTGNHADYTYNGNGCNATGDAIVVENAGSAYPSNNVTISDNAALDVTGTDTYALGAYTKNDEDAVEVALDNVTVPSAYGVGEATFSFANGAAIANVETPEGYEVQNNGNGSSTVVYAPLNPEMISAADAAAQDHNLFGLENTVNKYLKGTLLGVQTKAHHDAVTSENGEQEAAEGNDLRFVAVLDYNLLKDADDYGFVLAKVENTKTTTNTNFNGLQVGRGAGEKYISAKGTWNTVCGTSEEEMRYGNPDDDTTAYKYVTCAVNGIDDASKIAIRFYYKKDGKTFYAKYAGHNYQYTGCTAGITAAGNVY